MDPLISRYEKVVVVNLLDSEGKESCLGDEYAKVVSTRANQKAEFQNPGLYWLTDQKWISFYNKTSVGFAEKLR